MKSIVLKHWKSVLAGAVLILSGAVIFPVGYAVFITNGHPAELFRFLGNCHRIKSEYFKSVDDAQLWKGATKGMLEGLGDPYTTLLSGDTFDSFSRTTSGEYAGIGVLVGLDTDLNIRIFSVFPDSAAEEAGLKSGDLILSVDGLSASDLGLTGVSHTLRGQIGTTAALVVKREDQQLDTISLT
ncbi:S41 family peptidase [uncultured Dialister sp.]|uniref:S41 family peptidase n=1 Tax=uncultured Dialister sp. TaxID=278064 RepID=UPI0025D03DCF|nr:PDZ domain-containing protein [uncultured Dialister sp.]